ncbi:MAG TPA: NAD(P)H-dependent oxidoreductase [Terrimicrobiaceae bacterium]
MQKNIVVILGHPDAASYCGALADAYSESARQAGHSVKAFKLGDIEFDPHLRHGYNKRQELESGLLKVRDAISWSNHLVFVYPIWWGSMPALLKGFFDRLFLPGFAFRYRENSMLWDKLLTGRSAHAITTMDTPLWYYRFVYKMPGHNQIRKTILEFCGIKPVKVTSFGPIKGASASRKERWLRRVQMYAKG